MLSELRGLGGYLLGTPEAASGALENVRSNIDSLSLVRGSVGAQLSRMEFAVNHITNHETQLRDAESRIRDVDVASTVSELIAAQIRQQLATFVLTQANQEPQLVLQLLSLEP